MAKAGRARAGAGDRGDRLVRRRHHRHGAAGLARAAGRRRVRRQPRRARATSRSWCSRFVAVTAVARLARGVRGFASLLLGLAIGLVGIDSLTGQPRLTFGIPLLADGIDVVVVAVGHLRRRRGALGRRAPAAQGRRASSRWVGRGWASTTGARSWKPWLRGTAFGFPFGALPAGGAEIPTFLSYVTEKQARPSTPRSSARAPSRASPARRRPTTPRPPARWCRCWRWACRPTRRRRSCSRRFSATASSRARCCSTKEPDLVWALIASLFIGNVAAARAQPAAGAGCGPSCCASRAPTSTPASCSSPRMGAYAVQPAAVRPVPAAGARSRSGSRCGGSGCRCCR